MRCRACDTNLLNHELRRRYPDGTYVDLCDKCYDPAAEDFQQEEDVNPIEDNEDHLENWDDYGIHDSELDDRLC